MPPLTKGPTEGDLLKFDLGKNYTREVVTLLTGTAYKLGDVLGQITASGKFQLSPNSGADGSQVGAAVLLEDVDATAGDRAGVVIQRGPAILSRASLRFHSSVDDATKTATKIAQLTALGIVVRNTA